MGCVQSKPSYNSRRNRKKKSSRNKRSINAEPVKEQIVSPGHEADEKKSEQDDFGIVSAPEEDLLIKEQKMTDKRSPVRSVLHVQPDKEYMVMENEGKTAQKDLHNIQQKTIENHYPAQNSSVIRANPQKSGINPCNTILSEQEDTNSEEIFQFPTQFHSTEKNRKVSIAKSSQYEGVSSATLEKEVVVDSPDFMGEPFLPGSQVFYHQPDCSPNNISSKVVQQRTNPPNDTTQRIIHQNKIISTETQFPRKPNSSSNLDEPLNHNESNVIGEMPEIAESRTVCSEEIVGSICIDARTGEYTYYERGVMVGYVDKEEAERLSKDWPICPGTAENQGSFQMQGLPGHRGYYM